MAWPVRSRIADGVCPRNFATPDSPGFNRGMSNGKMMQGSMASLMMTRRVGVRSLQASAASPCFLKTLDTLQRVFDMLCREHRWPRESAQARRFGRMLIREYQAGTTDEGLLLRAGQAFVSQPSPQRDWPEQKSRPCGEEPVQTGSMIVETVAVGLVASSPSTP